MSMATDLKIVEEARRPLAMNPKKFALWLFITSVVMLFGAWTSAYIVKRADAGWNEIVLPWQFWMNTVIIALSSLTLVGASHAAKKDNQERLKLLISITSVLGVAFLAGQVLAYGELVALNEYFTGGHVSHSFIYVLTGAHGVHVISGVIFLLIALSSAYKNKIGSKRMDQLEMCSTYWHFLGILWLYLFVFLILNK
jgi:cytochrome c oxidase subunit III